MLDDLSGSCDPGRELLRRLCFLLISVAAACLISIGESKADLAGDGRDVFIGGGLLLGFDDDPLDTIDRLNDRDLRWKDDGGVSFVATAGLIV